MKQADRDRKAYELGKEFLLQFKEEGITPELLEESIHPSEHQARRQTISEIYLRLLLSAQNANMKSGVIGGSIDGVKNLAPVLCDFDPKLVWKKYKEDSEQVLDDIVDQIKPDGEVRRTSRSLWPQFCKSILSGARFLMEFADAEDFYQWVEKFDSDEDLRPALPMLLDYEIAGFGFPLACDFLKELGYANFAKPDVHLKDIFKGLELCPAKASDYHVFKAIVRVARNAGEPVSPYTVDKIFWRIGSGYFKDYPQVGQDGFIGRQKEAFLIYAQERLGIRS